MTIQPTYPGVFTTDGTLLNLFENHMQDPESAIYGNNIKLDHIVTCLSNICRFNGATGYHYSVAQHSLLALRIARNELKVTAPDILRGILLHDAVEAYIGDIIRPIKNHILVGMRAAVNKYMGDYSGKKLDEEQMAERYGKNHTAFKAAYEYLQMEDRIQRAIFDKYNCSHSDELVKADDLAGAAECAWFFSPSQEIMLEGPYAKLLEYRRPDIVRKAFYEALEGLGVNE